MTPRAGPVSAVLFAACVATCGGSSAPGRAVRLVSPNVATDEALARARDATDDGDYDRAEAILREVAERAPGDPLSAVATLRRARLRVVRGDLDGAQRLAEGVSAQVDPSLTMRRSLVLGLVASRRGDHAAARSILRPLARKMIDPAESLEVDCALAVSLPAGEAMAADASVQAARVGCETTAQRDDEPCRVAEGMRALARVAVVTWSGTRGLPTGLACDREDARVEMARALLARSTDPRSLADVIDVLPDGHPLRVDVARRLRTLAEELGETPRWLRWLADLPDTEATLGVATGSSGPPTLRVGVLAPTSGGRAYVGVEVLRAVQLALRGERNVDVTVEDEGETRESLLAGFDRLVARHVNAVIGPVREALLHDVETVAEERGVDVYPLAVEPECVAPQSRRVHRLIPTACDRASALRAAIVARGRQWRLFSAPGTTGDATAWHIAQDAQGERLTQVSAESAGGLTVVTDALGIEQRPALVGQSSRSPGRWVIDARAGLAGVLGVWVGARPGEQFEDFQARYCQVTGAPPGEFALMAHDVARAVLESARPGGPVWRALAPLPLSAGTVTASHVDDHAPAAARRCVSTVLPLPGSGDPNAP